MGATMQEQTVTVGVFSQPIGDIVMWEDIVSAVPPKDKTGKGKFGEPSAQHTYESVLCIKHLDITSLPVGNTPMSKQFR